VGRIYPEVQLLCRFINFSVALWVEYTQRYSSYSAISSSRGGQVGRIYPKSHLLRCGIHGMLCALVGRIYLKVQLCCHFINFSLAFVVGRIYPKVQLIFHFINLLCGLVSEICPESHESAMPLSKEYTQTIQLTWRRINMLCAFVGRIYPKAQLMHQLWHYCALC